MQIQWRLVDGPPADVDAVVVPAFADRALAGVSPAFLAGVGFDGQVGQVAHLPGDPPRVVLGLGRDRDLDGAAVRRAATCLARAAARYRRVAVEVPSAPLASATTTLRAFVEGFAMSAYRFTAYKSAVDDGGPERVDLVAPDTAAARAAVATGRAVAEGVLLARDLVNEPAGTLGPAAFAERAAAVAAATGLGCQVWDERRIAAERLGGLPAVGRGSPRPPRLVRLVYEPEHPVAAVALVGKGVTFDAGGLSLKSTARMADMKADMAGAAAVLGAMSTLAALGCPNRVEGWLPLAENLPGGDPIRIGDVLRMRDGTTVEVRDADAEGRLLLADALVLACEGAPDAVVDVATLTDAAAVALGRGVAAVMGNAPSWTEEVLRAADRAGEPLWPLPLPDTYLPLLRSRVADLVNHNTAVRHGVALLAGLFLREFVADGVPWAHLDIQGTAVSDGDDGEWVAGGTGFGVRTLIELVLHHRPVGIGR